MKDVPSDYYRRLHTIEDSHWWQLGLRDVTAELLGPTFARYRPSLLDAGCGTGGFLGWAAATGAFERLCGVDVSPQAIDIARDEVPTAELHVAPLQALPFEGETFDLVTLNDVLQHVDECDLDVGLRETRRVLRGDGALLVRTNGGRHGRRERSDWRLYDQTTLRHELERGGFAVVRMTYANTLPSLWAAARGRGPEPPTRTTSGIPSTAGRTTNAMGRAVLKLEARYLRNSRRSLPYGHTLLALAVPHAGG